MTITVWKIDDRDAEIERLRAELAEWRERCLGLGANRYWEDRWRDEAREIARFRAELDAKSSEIVELQTELHRVRPIADQVDDLRAELAEWKQSASVEAGLRREANAKIVLTDEKWAAAARRDAEGIPRLIGLLERWLRHARPPEGKGE